MIACMLLAQTVCAQIEKRSTELDKALWECRYECVQKIDTLGTQEMVDTMYLRIGDKVSQFYSYSAFYADSLGISWMIICKDNFMSLFLTVCLLFLCLAIISLARSSRITLKINC